MKVVESVNNLFFKALELARSSDVRILTVYKVSALMFEFQVSGNLGNCGNGMQSCSYVSRCAFCCEQS